MENDKISIKITNMPETADATGLEQRERGLAHLSFAEESAFYECITRGDVAGLQAFASRFYLSGPVVGRMSNDALRQSKYFAVACVTLATRYAIRGGLSEWEAYNFSDNCILHIDELVDEAAVNAYLINRAVQLTSMVFSCKERLLLPSVLRKALGFIEKHLTERLTVSAVACECGVSPNYLSTLFSNNMGEAFCQYVLRQKLEASKTQLGKRSYSQVAYIYGFCSQSYYSYCFKKVFGITPREYAETTHR